MTKQDFFKQYSLYRLAQFNFRVRMENSNFPCGYDDMLYENFANAENEWLDQQVPQLRQMIEMRYDEDFLEERYREVATFGKMHPKLLKRWITQRAA